MMCDDFYCYTSSVSQLILPAFAAMGLLQDIVTRAVLGLVQVVRVCRCYIMFPRLAVVLLVCLCVKQKTTETKPDRQSTLQHTLSQRSLGG